MIRFYALVLIHVIEAVLYTGYPGSAYNRQGSSYQGAPYPWTSSRLETAYGGIEPPRETSRIASPFSNLPDSSSFYGPGGSSYLNSGYSRPAPSLPLNEFINDLSMAFIKPLSSILIGPMQPMPSSMSMPSYGLPPYGLPIMPRPQTMNQFGINAGFYAGGYRGGNGIFGPNMPYGGGNGLLGPNGPYGSLNNHIGGSYGGLSSWPFVPPWVPVPATLVPPLVLPPPVSNIHITIRTATTPPTTTILNTETNVVPSIVSMPIETISPDELTLPAEATNP